jgi:hypothetical protein
MVQAEGYEAAHFFFGVLRHICLAFPSFDEDELVSSHYDVVLVAQEDDAVFFCDDICQMFPVAERAGFTSQEAVWLLAANPGVKVDDVQREPPFCPRENELSKRRYVYFAYSKI